MKTIAISKIVKHGTRVLAEHAPTILTGFAAAGVVATSIMTYKATLKADQYLNAMCDENASEETVKAVKRETYKFYIPAAVTGAATIGCVVGANYLNYRKITALAAACSVAETALAEHRDKIEQILGDKELEKIDNALALDHMPENVSSEDIINTGKGNFLCCEGYLTGAMFRSSEAWIRKCINDFNELVNQNTYASYNDLLSLLGLHEVQFGNEIGWNVHINGLLRVRFTYDGRDDADGEPYLIIEPINPPVHNYADII